MFKTLRRLHGHNLENQGLNNLSEAFQNFVTRARFFSIGRLRLFVKFYLANSFEPVSLFYRIFCNFCSFFINVSLKMNAAKSFEIQMLRLDCAAKCNVCFRNLTEFVMSGNYDVRKCIGCAYFDYFKWVRFVQFPSSSDPLSAKFMKN